MRRHFSLVALLLAALSGPLLGAPHSAPVSGLVLREGAIRSINGALLISSLSQPVVAFTVSPDGRHIVYVRKASLQAGSPEASRATLWIRDRTTGKDLPVGPGLGPSCCTLAVDPADRSDVFGKFELIHGAYWSSSRNVLVRFADGVHILSMNGSLRGDV